MADLQLEDKRDYVRIKKKGLTHLLFRDPKKAHVEAGFHSASVLLTLEVHVYRS